MAGFDPTNPDTERREDQMAMLVAEVHRLNAKVSEVSELGFLQKYRRYIFGAVPIVVLTFGGFGGYQVLTSTVQAQGKAIKELAGDSVSRDELTLQLNIRDQALDNLDTKINESEDRNSGRFDVINHKLDKLIDRQLNGGAN